MFLQMLQIFNFLYFLLTSLERQWLIAVKFLEMVVYEKDIWPTSFLPAIIRV